jgi:hypothetical protein
MEPNRTTHPAPDFHVGSWECWKEQSERAEVYAICGRVIEGIADIRFSRSRGSLGVIAKPVCQRGAFWNVESVGESRPRANTDRPAELGTLIKENFEAAIADCTSKPAALELGEAELAALLDATDWVELTGAGRPTDTQKKN